MNFREIIDLHIGHYSNYIGTHWLNLQEASFVYQNSAVTDINHDYLFREGKLSNNQICYVPRLLIIDAKGSLGSLKISGTLYDYNDDFYEGNGNASWESNTICGTLETPANETGTTSGQDFDYRDVDNVNTLWDKKVEVHCHLHEKKNNFLQSLDNLNTQKAGMKVNSRDTCHNADEFNNIKSDVNVWSDFLRPHLHPNTIFLLQNVWHQNIWNRKIVQNSSFKNYKLKENFAKDKIRRNSAVDVDAEVPQIFWGYQDGLASINEEKNDEIFDRIRLLAEDCDSLQGFQILADGHDGMGGVCVKVLENLYDDFSSKDVFSFVSFPPHATCNSTTTSWRANLVQCYSNLSEFSSIIVPLSLRDVFSREARVSNRWPHLSFQRGCPYESGSVLGAFLETVSVPWRRKSALFSMDHVTSVLTPLQRQFVAGRLSLPLGIDADSSFGDWLNTSSSTLEDRLGSRSVTNVLSGMASLGEVCSIRGLSHEKALWNKVKYSSCWELYEDLASRRDSNPVLRCVSGCRDPLKTTPPFPQIFETHVSGKGYISKRPPNSKEPTTTRATQVPAFAKLIQSDVAGQDLKRMHDVVAAYNVDRLRPQIGDLDKDSWNESLERLLMSANRYDLGHDVSSTDSDD